MRLAGEGHRPDHRVRLSENEREYLIELDVLEFTEPELSVEVTGPLVTVRGEQRERPDEEGDAFRVRERLEETFRLPDDAVGGDLAVFHTHGLLEIHAPRRRLVPR